MNIVKHCGTMWNTMEHFGKFWKLRCEIEEKKGGRKEERRKERKKGEGKKGRMEEGKKRKEYVCSSRSVFVKQSTRWLAFWACFTYHQPICAPFLSLNFPYELMN